MDNPLKRLTLTKEEVKREINVLKTKGFEQILILTGEDNKKVGMSYFEEMIPLFRENFKDISMEVQPLDQLDYDKLREMGVDGIYIYQETYLRDVYRIFHPKGKKSNFDYRLEAPFRACLSGMHRVGIGALLGLAPWRIDCYYAALHLEWLKKKFWKTQFSISFPRLRPASGKKPFPTYGEAYATEEDLARLIFAFRILDENVLLTLSTRERAYFRDNIMPLGITSISAESKTNPGGYACYVDDSLEQFSTNDQRNLEDVCKTIRDRGLEPSFYDWNIALSR